MADTLRASSKPRPASTGIAGTLAGDIKGGLVASTTCLAFSISNGALIYSGAQPSLLAFGISAGFATSAVAAVVLALTSTFRPVIGTANSTTAAPLGALMFAAVPSLAGLTPAAAGATVLALVFTTTAVAGLTLLLLGSARLGRVVRFIPFPVVAGFMGITGMLLVLGAVRFGTGVRVVWRELPRFLDAGTAVLLVLTLGFAALISATTRRFKHPLVLPGLLLAACLAADAGTYAAGFRIAHPPLPGLFLSIRADLPAGLPLLAAAPFEAHWSLIPPLVVPLGAYVLLVVLATLLTSNGLEAALNVDADYDRELQAQGLACFASSLAGGFVGNPSVGATMAGVTTGAAGRAAGLSSAAVMLVAWGFAMPLVPFVPRFVVGGFLAHIGFWILMTWCVATRRKMPRWEWCVVLGIVAITVYAGMVAAILAGLVAGCILFALDVSRIGVVRREYGLDQRASLVVRPSEELALLSREGGRIRFIELGGMLFFGSAYQILSRVKQRVMEGPATIVLDLTAVTGCDSSATAVVTRMRKLLRREGVGFAVVGADPMILRLLRTSGGLDPNDVVYPDIDRALEAAEVAVLAESWSRNEASRPLRAWLAGALGEPGLADRLIGRCRFEEHPPGDYLCRQGEPTNALLFIETGRVAVLIGEPPAERCVRVFGHHTIAGEHGFVLGLPRTASLRVEGAARVWWLDRATFAAMEGEEPELVIALLRDIVRLQSERLSFATRQAAALG